MTIGTTLALIALIIFLINISLSLVNVFKRDTVVPMGVIWGVWVVGMIFLILSWVL